MHQIVSQRVFIFLKKCSGGGRGGGGGGRENASGHPKEVRGPWPVGNPLPNDKS